MGRSVFKATLTIRNYPAREEILKHLSCGFFAAAVAVGSWFFASPVATFAQGMPPADFGSPPSGAIPIIFNDHHVYAKPDVDNKGRVLAALVRGNSILVPLRSMF